MFEIEAERIQKTEDLFEILKIKRTATQAEIRKAYHKLSLKYHIDKMSSAAGTKEVIQILSFVKEILTDDSKREDYLKNLECYGAKVAFEKLKTKNYDECKHF